MQDAQNLYLTLTDAAGNENDPDVKSALEKELCALKFLLTRDQENWLHCVIFCAEMSISQF